MINFHRLLFLITFAFAGFLGIDSASSQETTSPKTVTIPHEGVVTGVASISQTQPSDQSTVSGSVLDFRGTPVVNATVCCVPKQNSRPVIFTKTDTDGRFEFRQPVSLPTNLVVTSQSFSPQSKRIEQSAAAKDITLRLLPGRRVRFEVVDSEGNPIQGISIRTLSWNERRGLQLRGETDQRGQAVFSNAPANEVTYVFCYPNYLSVRQNLSAKPGVHRIKLTPLTLASAFDLRRQSAIDAELLNAKPVNPVVATLDKQAELLAKDFEQNLASDEWIRSKSLQFQPSLTATGTQTANGFAITQAVSKTWNESKLKCNVTLSGDFDIEADYSILEWEGTGGSLTLGVALSGEETPKARASCKVTANGTSILAQKHWTTATGLHRENHSIQQETNAGSLRIARRGETVSILARQAQGDAYRIIQQYELNASVIQNGGVVLGVQAPIDGSIQVLWQRVRIRAAQWQMIGDEKSTVAAVAIYDTPTNQVHRISQATGGYSHVGSPAWSPDQQWIAYDLCNGSTRDSRVMIVSVDGGEPKDIGFGSMPNFSPDGSMIAFSAFGEGIGVMNRDGSNRRILNRRGWQLQWSPEPNKLAYSLGGQIHSLDLETGTDRALMQGEAANQYQSLNWNMCWSHDGRQIVFNGTNRSTGDTDIAVFDLDQPDQIRVLVADAPIQHLNFSWSPDNQQILFLLNPPGSRPRMHTIASDGSGPPVRLPDKTEYVRLTSAVWSPDGTRIALTGVDRLLPPRRIYRIDANGKNLCRITWNFLDLGDHLSPDVSPDGKEIAFESFTGDPHESHIVHLNTDGTAVQDLGLGCIPSFTADGKRLAYSSFTGMKISEPRPGLAQRVSIGGTWTLQACPVDDRLACIRNWGARGANIRISEGQSGESKNLLVGEHANRYMILPFYLAWSPDGESIAFVGKRKDNSRRELAIVSTSGSDDTFEILGENLRIQNDIGWHPDGQRLIVAQKDLVTGLHQLHWVDRDAPHALSRVPGQPTDADNRHPFYTRDGSLLYFTSQPVATPPQ
ncbi:DUF1583 domain-containing protein [Rhodopirellula sallentina]|nr:DUF1583 domain-containing protein [Rhodopirellula sallentina]